MNSTIFVAFKPLAKRYKCVRIRILVAGTGVTLDYPCQNGTKTRNLGTIGAIRLSEGFFN